MKKYDTAQRKSDSDPSRPSSGRQAVAFDDLVGLNLISLPIGSETRRVLDATAAVRGMRLNHVVTVTHIPTLMSFVRAGIGAAVVPSTSVQGLLGDDLERRGIIEPDIALDIGIVLNPDRNLSPAAIGFLKTIEKVWTSH